MRFPQLARIRQEFQATRVDDVEGRVVELLAGFRLAERITPGARIALTAGSRGIRDMARVLRTLAAGLSAAGARPFVAPCMGSHGGATPQGQIDVLASLGITEKSVGAPIVSSLETVSAATSHFGDPCSWAATSRRPTASSWLTESSRTPTLPPQWRAGW